MTRTFEEGRLGVESHLAALLDAGYEVRRVDFLSDEELLEVDRNAMGLLHGEMARVHRVWFARYASRYRPRTARAVRLGETVGDSELAEFRRNQLRFRNRIAGLMDETGVDLWVTPASAGAAPRGYEQTGWGGMTTAWSYAGMPCIAVPAGLSSEQLPLGLQCVARFGDDERLLAWADDIARVFARASAAAN